MHCVLTYRKRVQSKVKLLSRESEIELERRVRENDDGQ